LRRLCCSNKALVSRVNQDEELKTFPIKQWRLCVNSLLQVRPYPNCVSRRGILRHLIVCKRYQKFSAGRTESSVGCLRCVKAYQAISAVLLHKKPLETQEISRCLQAIEWPPSQAAEKYLKAAQNFAQPESISQLCPKTLPNQLGSKIFCASVSLFCKCHLAGGS